MREDHPTIGYDQSSAKGLLAFYATRIGDNYVGGHARRTSALVHEWLKEDRGKKRVVIIDIPSSFIANSIAESYSDWTIIQLVDMPSNHMGDVIVCPHIGAHTCQWNPPPKALFLAGSQYFLRHQSFDNVNRVAGNYVLYCPGGNPDEFWSKVKRPDEHTSLVAPIENFEQKLANAKLVVTPASTTAMEALSLGVPILIVNTAPDQLSLYLEWTNRDDRVIYNEQLIINYDISKMSKGLDGNGTKRVLARIISR